MFLLINLARALCVVSGTEYSAQIMLKTNVVSEGWSHRPVALTCKSCNLYWRPTYWKDFFVWSQIWDNCVLASLSSTRTGIKWLQVCVCMLYQRNCRTMRLHKDRRNSSRQQPNTEKKVKVVSNLPNICHTRVQWQISYSDTLPSSCHSRSCPQCPAYCRSRLQGTKTHDEHSQNIATCTVLAN